MSRQPPVMVSYAVTRMCNLNCPHCYSDARSEPSPLELSTEEAKELIRDVADMGTRLIIFDGGEPTLRPDLPELISFAADSGLSPLLGTNGMVDTLTYEYALRLREAGLRAAAVSIDSPTPEEHDEFRGVRGAWDRTMKGIENLREAGVPFQIGFTLRHGMVDRLEEMVELAKRLGAIALEVFEFIPVGRGSEHERYELTMEERTRAVRKLVEIQRREDLIIRMIACPQYWVEVERTVPELERMKFIRSCCGAGTRYATILYDGTVIPCMLLPIPLGNVRTKPFSQIWQESKVLNDLRDRSKLKDACAKCPYADVCIGARCRAYAKTGDYLAEDPGCWLRGEFA